MKISKKHMQECISTHTMLHSLFGLGLGMILGGVLHLTMWGNILVGIVFVGLAFVADILMGSKK